MAYPIAVPMMAASAIGALKQAVVRQRLGQAAVDGERAAPVAVLLAVGNQRGILVEAVDDRLEDTRRAVGTASSSRTACRPCRTRSALSWRSAARRGFSLIGWFTSGLASDSESIDWFEKEHRRARQFGFLVQVHARRQFVVDGQLEGLEHDILDFLGHGVQIGLR